MKRIFFCYKWKNFKKKKPIDNYKFTMMNDIYYPTDRMKNDCSVHFEERFTRIQTQVSVEINRWIECFQGRVGLNTHRLDLTYTPEPSRQHTSKSKAFSSTSLVRPRLIHWRLEENSELFPPLQTIINAAWMRNTSIDNVARHWKLEQYGVGRRGYHSNENGVQTENEPSRDQWTNTYLEFSRLDQ